MAHFTKILDQSLMCLFKRKEKTVQIYNMGYNIKQIVFIKRLFEMLNTFWPITTFCEQIFLYNDDDEH